MSPLQVQIPGLYTLLPSDAVSGGKDPQASKLTEALEVLGLSKVRAAHMSRQVLHQPALHTIAPPYAPRCHTVQVGEGYFHRIPCLLTGDCVAGIARRHHVSSCRLERAGV